MLGNGGSEPQGLAALWGLELTPDPSASPALRMRGEGGVGRHTAQPEVQNCKEIERRREWVGW